MISGNNRNRIFNILVKGSPLYLSKLVFPRQNEQMSHEPSLSSFGCKFGIPFLEQVTDLQYHRWAFDSWFLSSTCDRVSYSHQNSLFCCTYLLTSLAEYTIYITFTLTEAARYLEGCGQGWWLLGEQQLNDHIQVQPSHFQRRTFWKILLSKTWQGIWKN